MPARAADASQACAALQNPAAMLSAPYDGARLISALSLLAGERVHFSATGAASVKLAGGVAGPREAAAGSAPFSASFIAPQTGQYVFQYEASRGALITARCESAGAASAAAAGGAQDFMRRRADRLLSEDTSQTSLQRRAAAALAMDQAINATTAAGEQGAPSQVTVKGSANAIAKSYATAAQKPFSESRLDFWLEGRVSRYEETLEDASGRRKKFGDVGMLYFGADYLVNPQIMVGALAQFDEISEEFEKSPARVSGKGFMAGPYASIQLAPDVFFDARAAWGASSNAANAEDGAHIDFETGRKLVRGQLIANRSVGGFQFSPSLALAVLEDEAGKGFEGAGYAQPGATTGRFTAGSAISYRAALQDGGYLQPRAALSAAWDVQAIDQLTDFEAFSNETGAKAEAGIGFGTAQGLSLEAAAALEGIGASDFEAWSGRLSLKTPLN